MENLSLCSMDSHFVMYFILHYWSNKESITIASICLCASCSEYIPTATADPMQNNKSVKALLTHNVQKNTVLRVGSHVKYSTWLCLMLYLPLNPTPHTVLPHITLNGALTYTYYEPTSLCRLQRLAK